MTVIYLANGFLLGLWYLIEIVTENYWLGARHVEIRRQT
jgi:hypothetical protein